jgi:hypothetical protein
MKTFGYSIIHHDGRLLSRLDIKTVAAGREIDVEFERDFCRSLSTKKLKQMREIHYLLSEAFPGNSFAIVQITWRRGRFVVNLPDGDRPSWISKAVESLGGKLIA